MGRWALRAAGASRTYHRAFPAATGLSGIFAGIGFAGWRTVPADSMHRLPGLDPFSLLDYHTLRNPTIPALSEALIGSGRPGRITLAWGIMKLASRSPVGVIY